MLKHYDVGDSVTVEFPTKVDGALQTLAGSPAAAVRAFGSNTDITSGVGSITVDGANTGRHYVSIDTTGYTEGTLYRVFLTAGTVGGVSVAGEPIGEFYIRSALERLSRVAFKSYWKGINQQSGTLQGATSNSVVTLGVDASTLSGHYVGWRIMMLTTSLGSPLYDQRVIKSYTTAGSTKLATVDRDFNNVPSAGDSYLLFPPDMPFAQFLMFATAERLVVDTTGFAGSTTSFQITNTTDESDAYTNQGLYCASGANAGETFFVTGYSYSSKVRLTVSQMKATPASGDIFLKMGRRY